MKGRLVVSHVVVHMLLERISDIVCCDLCLVCCKYSVYFDRAQIVLSYETQRWWSLSW